MIMETKTITKTIKELADELDGHADQLHRTIAGYDKLSKNQNNDIKDLVYEIDLERSARARAEKVSDTSIFVMFSCVAVMFSITVYNYLFG